MKRLIAILLIAVMAISLAACGVKDAPPADSESPAVKETENNSSTVDTPTEGDSAVFEGVVTEEIVRGYRVADESDFSYDETADGIRITGYIGEDTIVVIPENIAGKPVVGMAAVAFGNECAVRGVLVPSGVKELEAVFGNNMNLEVVIWESAEVAGANLFNSCIKLHTIILGDNLREIGENAFGFCSSLEELYIPASVEEIDPNIVATVFCLCNKLTITGEAGSFIETFCAEQGIPFKAA